MIKADVLKREFGTHLIYVAFAFLAAFCSPLSAAVLNEWSFGFDPVNRSFSQSENTGSQNAIFGYGNESALQTDGQDGLLCSQADPAGGGMWTNGAILIAKLPGMVSNGVQFLRMDVQYDLNSTSRPSGSGGVVGFAVGNIASNLVSGVALKCMTGAGTSPPFSVNTISSLSETGTLTVVARVNLENELMDIWFSSDGQVDGFSLLSPHASVPMPLSSFDALCFLATGDIKPSGADDFVRIDLVRHAETWDEVLQNDPIGVPRRYFNEWTFERDQPSSELAQALNSGTANPAAQFASGGGSTVFTGDGALYCIGEDAGQYGMWTAGSILNAGLQSTSTGRHYLRYDVRYDFSSPHNDSGALLSVYFTDSVGARAAGLVLAADNGKLGPTAPSNRSLVLITNSLPRAGTLTAIAGVDLDLKMLKVWYAINGSGVFDENSPSAVSAVSLESVGALCFHATGDFQVSSPVDSTRVENIRHATSWSEITAPVVDENAAPNLHVKVSSPGNMFVGSSNVITVVVENLGGLTRQVSSEITHDGAPADFTLTHNILPVPMGAGMSLTNTYWLTANTAGDYLFSTVARSAETNSLTSQFNLLVDELPREMALAVEDGKAVLSWSGGSNGSCSIWYTFNLMNPFLPLEGASGLTTNRFVDAVHTNVPTIFYRIIVSE